LDLILEVFSNLNDSVVQNPDEHLAALEITARLWPRGDKSVGKLPFDVD